MKTLFKKLRAWRDKVEVKILNWATKEKETSIDWDNSILIRKTETPNQKDFNTWIRYHKIYNHLWRF